MLKRFKRRINLYKKAQVHLYHKIPIEKRTKRRYTFNKISKKKQNKIK